MKRYRNDTSQALTVAVEPAQLVEPGWTIDVDDDVHLTGLTLVEPHGNASGGTAGTTPDTSGGWGDGTDGESGDLGDGTDGTDVGEPGQVEPAGTGPEVPVVVVDPELGDGTDPADASAPASIEHDPEASQ